jgi:predicted nucleotidyltransferase
MDNEEVLTLVKEYVDAVISNKIPVAQVYLFGSILKESNDSDSDIDVALFLKKMSDEIDLLNQLMRIRRNFDLRIEPHAFLENDINNGNPFINKIVRTGLRIY